MEDHSMFRIQLLPAHHGDSVLIEYGDAGSPHRILIDGGTESSADAVAARLAKIGQPAALDLVIVTHVDEDHIGGMLKLLIAKAIATKDFWFNSYKNLFPPGRLGAAMGEGLTTAIEDAQFAKNAAFGGNSVVVPDTGPLPQVKLPDGATVTLVSPTWDKLEKLRDKWEAECKKAKIMPGEGQPPSDVLGKHPPPTNIDVEQLLEVPFKQDPSAANGSCIAFIFEYDGKRVLFGADAHPGVVLESLKRLSDEPVKLDAFKVCHHGSRNNTTTKLLDHVSCSRFLISSNGETFGHPDPETIARIVSRDGNKELCFNYDSEYTQPWNRKALRDQHDYSVTFPDNEDEGLVLEL
jgi:beta-lactamase superfamily II metal-dependent hydrolase